MAATQTTSEPTAFPATMASIDATPRTGQMISHEGRTYTTIREGKAYILVPPEVPTSTDPKMSKEDTQKQQVFYNPIQQFNRDLSVLAIKTFSEDIVKRKRDAHEQKKRKAARGAAGKKRKLGATGSEEVAVSASNPDEAAQKRIRVANGDGQQHETSAQAVSDEVQNVTVEKEQADEPTYKPLFSILDALSATGLRALRYAQEIPAATSIVANDMSTKATASIALNVKHNKLENKIRANTGNAIVHMYSFADQSGYDVIDLDPYGTAAPFIDSAIQAISNDGLLCVTCTDSAIFASHGYLEKTYSQYGGLPLKGDPCHEGGLRLVLHAIASSAARYGMAIEPLLSLSIDYYVRVFVRVRKIPNDVKLLAGKTMLVYHCQNGCGSWSTQFLARNKPQKNVKGELFYKYSYAQGPSADHTCEHCGTKTHLSGPMYGGPIHNVGFIERMLAQLSDVDPKTYPTKDRMEGMLHTALEETTYGVETEGQKKLKALEPLDPLIPKQDPATVDYHPFFFIPSSLAKVIHCSAPSLAAVRGALRKAGYRVSMSHCKAGSVRTDAPWRAIWHVMLEWVRQKQPLKNALKVGTSGHAIMSKGSAHQVDSPAKATELTITENGNSSSEHAGTVQQSREVGETSGPTTEASQTLRPSYLGTDFEVVFDEEMGKDRDRGKYVRYQLAPRENWGPMSRAK